MNRAEQLLIPAKSSEQLWSDLVLRFDVVGNTVSIADLRNFKARLKSFGPNLPVMPLETDILAEKQFSVVADVLARRKGRTGGWKQVCAAAGRNAEVPSRIRAKAQTTAESRVPETDSSCVPGFRPRSERFVFELARVFEFANLPKTGKNNG